MVRAVSDRIIKPRQLSAATALRELAEVCAIPIKMGGRCIWVRTDIKGHVAKLFQSLVRISPKPISKGLP